ncbi:MAG TPA: hypothetical protein DCS91_18975 [Microcoleaceae bacterium UBA11344]|nr:hypothetical protein [Microcoleaceae cyanobacterium UBA11344]
MKLGVDRITEIFKTSSYLWQKTLVNLRYQIPQKSFILCLKMLFSLIATHENKLTVVGEAFQIRNI